MQAWWEHQYMVGVGIGLRCLPKFGVDTSPCPQGRLYIVSWKKISAILIILCSCYEAVLWSFFKKNPLLLSNLIKGQSGFMFWLNSWREGDYLKKEDHFKWKLFIYSFMNYLSKHEDPFAQSHQIQNEKNQIRLS